jgi:predicted nicotinamide N-methyase
MRACVRRGSDVKEFLVQWGHDAVDLVLASDCIYNLTYSPALLDTLVALTCTSPLSCVVFAYSVRNVEGEERFFDCVRAHYTITMV